MMKWHGWGSPNFVFPMDKKPSLWPWIKAKLGVDESIITKPVDRAQIVMPAPILNAEFVAAIQTVLSPDQILSGDDDRLLHSYGKSYPDLFRVRRGQIRKAPDLVLMPQSHEDVEAIVQLAQRHNVCVIPFGGGTNIVGAVDPLENGGRMTVTLNMQRMYRILSVDPQSMTATIEAGALGPQLERDLEKQGFALGHYPDSFEYSTLGGWIATRSAGMQSDTYGKIEDMVVALRFVTPTGTLATRLTPASSAGPDLNRLVVGSEGVLGIITQATMRVHRSPAIKDYRGFLFRSFREGTAAIEECVHNGIPPSMIRLQDEGETELAFNLKSPKKGLEAFVQKIVKKYLLWKGFNRPCIMIVGFEGQKPHVKASSTEAFKIFKRCGAFPLGQSVGKTWYADKFNVPYLRDFVMDYGCMVDVSETAAVWGKLLPLYDGVIAAASEKFARETGKGYIGCHISHTYRTGACLYFTYAARQIIGRELEQYNEYKKFVTDTIMRLGGTVSHHHAIGYEHMPWMEEEVSATGLRALRGLKHALDPQAICNPGKLIPAEKAATVTAAHAAPVRGLRDTSEAQA